MNFWEFETMLLASNSSRTLPFRTYTGYVPMVMGGECLADTEEIKRSTLWGASFYGMIVTL